MTLSPEDVQDILAILDSSPYDELQVATSRFSLTLRRTPDGGWTEQRSSTAPPVVTAPPAEEAPGPGPPPGGTEASPGPSPPRPGLHEVLAPLPGTFYRAPSPGAAFFVEVGTRVGRDSVVGIVETMKMMTSVYAGAPGTVAEICLANGAGAETDTVLVRIDMEQ